MYPTLFTVGSISVTSFGFFLALAFLLSTFAVWRLSKIYDINEEKILDLTLITFFGGLIGSRVYFIFSNLSLFNSLDKVFLINKHPGLSFWGGLIGGVLVLSFFLKRTKLNFWQVIDFAAVGAALGISLGSLGCFFGGCAYGVISDSLIALPVVGVLGKRFPISAIESLIFLLVFVYLWKQVIRFHFAGKITSNFLIAVGIIKYVLETYRGDDKKILVGGFSYGQLWAAILLTLGIVIFYYGSKRNFLNDIRYLLRLPFSPKKRNLLLLQLKKNVYNHRIGFKIRAAAAVATLYDLPKYCKNYLKRRLNVKPTPTNYR